MFRFIDGKVYGPCTGFVFDIRDFKQEWKNEPKKGDIAPDFFKNMHLKFYPRIIIILKTYFGDRHIYMSYVSKVLMKSSGDFSKMRQPVPKQAQNVIFFFQDDI